MMKMYIPKPCNENWDGMKPEERGRFCLSCSKTVVDFTTKSKEEIQNFFRETTENVCGRFLSKDLDPVPVKVGFLSRNFKRINKFALALYLVFGSLLFSCSTDPGKAGQPSMGEVPFTQGKQAQNDTIYETTMGIPPLPENQRVELGKVATDETTPVCTDKKESVIFPDPEVTEMGEPMVENE